MEEKKEVLTEEEDILNDKGFALIYNISMVSSIATVAMFIVGLALYLAVIA